MNADECCLVCAEPLEWIGVGPCGHNETCSKCVARWRFVLKDTRCMMCKQEQDRVFMTRFMGDFTTRLDSQQFGDLQNRASRGELYLLKDIEGYFDDVKHYETIKALCGYTHPMIAQKCRDMGKEPPTFYSIDGMRRWADGNLKMNFCNICMESRQVFISEQLLYNKADLDKHMRTGDETGPLAGTSFKGHPLCQFCRKRFYDSNELYKHMQTEHETCFLCRRQHPDQYVYYRHYKELEDHFQSAHNLCPHPACLDKKFIVFQSEQELKRHMAQEHGDELRLTRAQRREAHTLPLNVQYRDRDEGSGSHAGINLEEGAAVIIGGGYNVTSRINRGQASQAMRHSRSAAEIQASLHDQGGSSGFDFDSQVSSVTFTADDFPSVSGNTNGLQAPGFWAGASGATSSTSLSQEHFPALPTMTKAQKKKLKAGQASLVDQLRAQNMPVRIINRGAAAGTAGTAGAGSGSGTAAEVAGRDGGFGGSSRAMTHASSQPNLSQIMGGPSHRSSSPAPTADDFPALPISSRPATASRAPPPAARPAPVVMATTPAARLSGGGTAASSSRPAAGPPPPPPSADDFPSLMPSAASSSSSQARGAAPPPASAPRYTAAAFLKGAATGSSNAFGAGTAAAAAPPPPQLQESDFPGLPASSKNKKKAAGASANAKKQQQPPSTPPPAPAPTTPPTSSPTTAAGGSSSSGGGAGSPGVSRSLQQANKELIQKIQAQLSDDARFATFKQESTQFLRGELSAGVYHRRILDLGLMGLVTELAGLCPVPDRREALLEVHRAFVASPAAQDPTAVASGWVPPEAALAAIQQAEQHASWACPRCTLLNAPDVMVCEACQAVHPSFAPPEDAFPTLGAAYAAAGPSGGVRAERTGSGGMGGGSGSASSSRGAAAVATGGAAADVADGAAGGPSGGKKRGKGTKITIGLGTGTGKVAAPPAPAWGVLLAWRRPATQHSGLQLSRPGRR